jgi:hypothetical protein
MVRKWFAWLGRATFGRLAPRGLRAAWLRHLPDLKRRRGFPPP